MPSESNTLDPPAPEGLTLLGAPADDMCGADGCVFPQPLPVDHEQTTNQE